MGNRRTGDGCHPHTGDIAGLKAQKDPAALAQAVEQLEKSGKPFREADVLQRAYDNAMRQYGTGSDLQKAAQAVTGALAALAGNNGGCAGERRLAVRRRKLKAGR